MPYPKSQEDDQIDTDQIFGELWNASEEDDLSTEPPTPESCQTISNKPQRFKGLVQKYYIGEKFGFIQPVAEPQSENELPKNAVDYLKRREKKFSKSGFYVPSGEFKTEPVVGDEVSFELKQTSSGAIIARRVEGGSRPKKSKSDMERCTLTKLNERGFTFAKLYNSNQRAFVHVGLLSGKQERRLKGLGSDTIEADIQFVRKKDGRSEAIFIQLIDQEAESKNIDKKESEEISELQARVKELEEKLSNEQKARESLEKKIIEAEENHNKKLDQILSMMEKVFERRLLIRVGSTNSEKR